MAEAAVVTQRRRGILAFLDDTVQHFQYDVDHWKKNENRPTNKRPRNHRRKARDDDDDDDASSINRETLPLSALLQDKQVAIFFLFDPFQPHSIKIRDNLVQLCAAHSNTVHCLALSQHANDTTTASFLNHTGFALSPYKPILTTVLSVSQIPAVAVVQIQNGRKISAAHEELALEWNSKNHCSWVVEQWLEGKSGLSIVQQVMAACIFPACTIL